MSKPHIIRLRGPWEYRVLAEDIRDTSGIVRRQTAGGAAGKTQIPSDWSEILGATFRGNVRYTRHFHMPTGLDPSSRVDLVIDSVDATGIARLSGQLLGEFDYSQMPATFDITDRLQSRNELVIDVDLPAVSTDRPDPPVRSPDRQSATAGGLVGEVRLEIR